MFKVYLKYTYLVFKISGYLPRQPNVILNVVAGWVFVTKIQTLAEFH